MLFIMPSISLSVSVFSGSRKVKLTANDFLSFPSFSLQKYRTISFPGVYRAAQFSPFFPPPHMPTPLEQSLRDRGKRVIAWEFQRPFKSFLRNTFINVSHFKSA
jgi:hypothetical protein